MLFLKLALPVLAAVQSIVTTVVNISSSISFSISDAVPNVTSNHIWWFFTNRNNSETYLEPNSTAKYTFSTDQLTLRVNNAQFADSGNYTAAVRNEAGIQNLTIEFLVYSE